MRLIVLFSAVLLIVGCAGNNYEKAENAQDAGREFIRASLDGDYKKARFYMLKDTSNLVMIEQQQRNYQQLSSAEKSDRRGSNIRPISIDKLSDSLTIYTYYNTYNTRDTTKMTIVNSNGEWLVDLKTILKH